MIPGVIPPEELLAVTAAGDGVTFDVVMNWSDSMVRLTRAHQDGEVFPDAVISTDAQMWALESVRVASVPIGSPPSVADVQLRAEVAARRDPITGGRSTRRARRPPRIGLQATATFIIR